MKILKIIILIIICVAKIAKSDFYDKDSEYVVDLLNKQAKSAEIDIEATAERVNRGFFGARINKNKNKNKRRNAFR